MGSHLLARTFFPTLVVSARGHHLLPVFIYLILTLVNRDTVFPWSPGSSGKDVCPQATHEGPPMHSLCDHCSRN